MWRLAIHNGRPTQAKRTGRKPSIHQAGGQWLLIDACLKKGDLLLVAGKYPDREQGGWRWAWFKLVGCRLVFQDFLDAAQIAQQQTLNKE